MAEPLPPIPAGFELINAEPPPVAALPPIPPGFSLVQPQVPGGLDFSRPDPEVRDAIRKLPKEQQDAAVKAWAQARVTKERGSRGALDTAGGHLRAVARGTFVGPWLDEIQGGVSSLAHRATGGAVGAPYDESVAFQRANDAAYDKENPYLGTALKVGGGLAGGLGSLAVRGGSLAARGAASLVGGPFAAAAPAASVGGRIAQGVGVGATHGASYGAGEAEGGFTPEGLASRAGGAATGAAIGGALGGALSPVADVVGGVYRAATTPTARRAEDLFARRAAMDGPAGMDPAAQLRLYGDRADRTMGISPTARLADAGGENVGNLMRMANNVPNDMRETTRKALDVRAGHQWKRIEDAVLKEGMDGLQVPPGTMPTHFYDQAEAMAAKLEQIGSQRIQPTLAQPTPMTARLAEVLERDPMKKIMDRVTASFSAEGRTAEAIKLNPGRPPVGDTEFLFRLKLELDDLIGQTQKAAKMGATPQAGHDLRALTILKKDLLDNIQNPAFKAGLKEYAGEAQLLTAMTAGKDEFSQLQARQIQMRLKELEAQSPQHATFYRIGALRDLVEQIRTGNATNDRTKGLLGSPDMALKVKALMPNEAAYRRFMRVIQAEKRMAFTRGKVQGNSSTAGQLSELQDATRAGDNAMAVARIGGNLATGRWTSALTGIADKLGNSYARLHGVTPAVAEEVLKLGMSRDPRRLQSVLSRSPAREPDARTAIINALMAGTSGAR